MQFIPYIQPLFFSLILGVFTASADKEPLPLPSDFDYDTWLVGKEVDGMIYHPPRSSVRLCEALLANGTAQDIVHVEKIIPGVLNAQIQDPNFPYYGAFKWELEMEAVEDLNAVQFLLFSLIPILIEHQNKLSDETTAIIRESIRIGLINIATIDVHFEYTNIVLKDITNTILGGECIHSPLQAS